MTQGLRVAVILLLGASLVTVAGTGLSATTDCGVNVAQDDAHSDRDAGPTPDSAVQLANEDVYPASISYPQGTVLDAEDWFLASWDGDTERRVMVNISTRVHGLSYALPIQQLPAPQMELEAYAPGAETPTHTGETGDDGVVRLNFTTDEPGIWSFRVFLPQNVEQACPTAESLDTASQTQAYNLYWGCHPHCVITGE